MYAVELTHDYPVAAADVYAAIGAGSLFISRGALPSSIVIDFRAGGGFSFERGDRGRVAGVFTRVEPGELVEFVWAGMTATLRFEPAGSRSRLLLRHTDIPTEELRQAYDEGWREGLAHLVLPPLFPEERAATGDEGQVLRAFLAYQRQVMTGKLRGLSEADARRRIVPSETTPIALVRHLAFVEREWFGMYLAERSAAAAGLVGDDSDGWHVPPDLTVADVIADYESACADSDAVAKGLALADHVPHPRLGRVSVRWVYTHMIEETARHAGHMDILRELIDGATGVDP